MLIEYLGGRHNYRFDSPVSPNVYFFKREQNKKTYPYLAEVTDAQDIAWMLQPRFKGLFKEHRPKPKPVAAASSSSEAKPQVKLRTKRRGRPRKKAEG